MKLFPEHIADLKASGITQKTAQAEGLYSIGAKELQGTLGPIPEGTSLLIFPYSENGLFRAKLFPPWSKEKEKRPRKYLQPAGSKNELYVPSAARAVLHDFTRRLVITEGEKKALAACQRGLPTISAPGVWNWLNRGCDGAKIAAPALDIVAWMQRSVDIVFDSDIWTNLQSQRALYALGADLMARGANVSAVILEPGSSGEKTGLDDYLLRHNIKAFNQLPRISLEAKEFKGLKAWHKGWMKRPRTKKPESDRPMIDAGSEDLPAVAAQAWAAIEARNKPPWIFSHVSGPVVLKDEPVLHILQVSEDRMRHDLVRVALWYKETREGTKISYPSRPVVNDLLVDPRPPLPRLKKIVEYPFYTCEGTLHTKPGYSEESECYSRFSDGLVVPEVSSNPSAKVIKKARELLFELMCDFPFVSEAERAHAIGFMILPFVRELIDGPTPLHLFEAPKAGTGKGLLAQVLSIPSLGLPLPFQPETEAQEEWRKRITSALLESPTYVFFDNIEREIRSGVLSSAVTSIYWKDRILGASKEVHLPVQCVWGAAGNNPLLSSEIARRTVRIRLDAKMEQPWQRDHRSFRHPELIPWAQGNRANLLAAILTIANKWLAEGRPGPEEDRSLGSFESWARVIGGILCCAEISGFLGNVREFYEASDIEGQSVRVFVFAWWERYKTRDVGANELFEVAINTGLDFSRAASDHGRKIAFGRFMLTLRGQQFGNLKVEARGEKKHARQWRLVKIGEKRVSIRENSPETHPKLTGIKSSRILEEKGMGEFSEFYTSARAKKTFFLNNRNNREKKIKNHKDGEYRTHHTHLSSDLPEITIKDVGESGVSFLEYSPFQIGLDTETTGLDSKKDKLALIQVDTGEEVFLLPPLPHEFLRQWIEDPGVEVIVHNAAFDLLFLCQLWPDLRPRNIWDTKLAEQLFILGREYELGEDPFTLSTLSDVYLGVQLDKGDVRTSFAPFAPLTDEQVEYAAKDAAVLPHIAAIQKKRATDQGLLDVIKLESDFAFILGLIEQKGVKLADAQVLEELRVQIQQELKMLEVQIEKEAGRPINPNSSPQVYKILAERGTYENYIKGYKPKSVSKEVLAEINDPIARLVLQYRPLASFVNGFLSHCISNDQPVLSKSGKQRVKNKKPVFGAIDSETGRIYPRYRQMVDTGRTVSKEPHIQGVAKGRGYRRVVVAEEGHKLVVCDFSQIELRILAEISQDPRLIKAFEEEKDLHTTMAASVFGVKEDQVTSDQRSAGKTMNFGLIYGMSSRTLAAKLGVPENEAFEFMSNYFASIPRAKALLDRWTVEVYSNFYSETLYGRKRYYPAWFGKRANGRYEDGAYRSNQAKNTPIQGTGADILKLAVLYVHDAIRPYHADIVIINQDEIVVEVIEDQAEEVAQIVKKEMERAGNEILKTVPVVVDLAVGDTWEKP